MAGDVHFDSVVLLLSGYPVKNAWGGVNNGIIAFDHSPLENDVVGNGGFGGTLTPRFTYDAKRDLPSNTLFEHVFQCGHRRLEVAYNTGFDFSTRDFTIEGYIWAGKGDGQLPTTAQENFGMLFSKRPGGAPFDVQISQDTTTNQWIFSYGTTANNSNSLIMGSNAASRVGISHVAVCRQGNALRTFVDGVPGASATLTANILNTTSIVQMFQSTVSLGNTYLAGICAGIRVTMGVSRYNAAFTPEYKNFPHYKDTPGDPAEQEAEIVRGFSPPDPHYNRVLIMMEKPGRRTTKVYEDDRVPDVWWRARGTAYIDRNSSLPTKAAMTFDGTTGATSSAFTRADARTYFREDFTVEFKFRARAWTNNICGLFQSLVWTTYAVGLQINARKLLLYNNNWHLGALVWTQPAELELNRTYTFALVKKQKVIYIFLDGQLIWSEADRNDIIWNLNAGGGIVWGAAPSQSNNAFNGWIGNVRITDGVGRYWQNYTVGNSWFSRESGELVPKKFRLWGAMPAGFDKDLVMKHLSLMGPNGPIASTITSSQTPSAGALTDLTSISNDTEVIFTKSQISAGNFYLEFDAPSNTQPLRTLAVKAGPDLTTSLRHARMQYLRDDGFWENHPFEFKNLVTTTPNAVHVYNRVSNPLSLDSTETQVGANTTITFNGTNGSIVRTSTNTATWPRLCTKSPLPIGSYYVEITTTSDDFAAFGLIYGGWGTSYIDPYVDGPVLFGNGKFVTIDESANNRYVTDRRVVKNKTVGVMLNVGSYWASAYFIIDGFRSREIRMIPTNNTTTPRNWYFAIAPSYTHPETGQAQSGQRNISFVFNDGKTTPFVYPLPAGYTAGFDGPYSTTLTDPAYISASIDAGAYRTSNVLNVDYDVGLMKDQIMITANHEGDQFGYIKNYCYNDNDPLQPVRRKIMLFDVFENRVVESTWSEEGTGLYQFTWISLNREYLILSHDHTKNRTSAIAGPMKATRIPNT